MVAAQGAAEPAATAVGRKRAGGLVMNTRLKPRDSYFERPKTILEGLVRQCLALPWIGVGH